MATGTKMARKPAKPARRAVPQAARKSATKSIAKVAPRTALAVGMRDYFIQRLELEHATTLRVLKNVNPGNWRPDPKSRTPIELAWHIVTSERWFFDSIISGNFNPAEAAGPPTPATMREVISYYEDGFARNVAAVKKLSGAHLAKVTDFFGMKTPMYEYLGMSLVHTVHHRAQLATYLRPLGGKCPDIYGGSADEPFEM